MNNNPINIYVTGRNLTDIMRTVSPPSGLMCRINTLEAGMRINLQGINIFILKRLPAKIIEGVRYVLCSNNPAETSSENLSLLYDLWPEPLTPSLAKFYFTKLLERVRSEILNTSEEIEHQKRIIEMARQDYLTGLATRWYLHEYIKKNQDERNVTCIYFDLDNFKKVNDTYGHQAGDRALAATAEMMQRDFTDGFCARMGGDEFMIVLLGQRDASEVEAKVNAFMTGLLEYYAGTKTMQALSVSAGIAQKTHGDDKSIDRLIHESDIALYEAKKSGRARCKIYMPELESIRSENESNNENDESKNENNENNDRNISPVTPRNYYFVDYENVKSDGLTGVHKLDGNNTVCIFYSRNAERLSPELNLNLKESKAEIIYRHVEVGTRNALDFQLSSYLGEVITENEGKECRYFIVSKDNGFSSLIPFWQEKGIEVEIVADVSGTKLRDESAEILQRVKELTGDTEDAADITKIVSSCRTKTEINSELLKKFRDNTKAGEIYRAIRPLIAHRRGR